MELWFYGRAPAESTQALIATSREFTCLWLSWAEVERFTFNKQWTVQVESDGTSGFIENC